MPNAKEVDVLRVIGTGVVSEYLFRLSVSELYVFAHGGLLMCLIWYYIHLHFICTSQHRFTAYQAIFSSF